MKSEKMDHLRRRTDQKGFSLVELIVVIAIMAVLIGVLAPQFLKYVEKTRLQKDNSALAEIAEAIRIAAANEEVYDELAGGTLCLWSTREANNAQTFDLRLQNVEASSRTSYPNLGKELEQAIGDKFTTQSNTYNKSYDIALIVQIQNGRVIVSVSNYIENDGTLVGLKPL